MKTDHTHTGMTRTQRASDPTSEPRGFHRIPAKTRHLRRHRQREYTGTHTVALTPCEVVASDGTRHRFTKQRTGITHTIEPPAQVVRTRQLKLRGPITDYIAVAERVGLNPLTVATEYRYRRDNGYALPHEVTIEVNATFRGGDH